ncbi:uncharacterized protein LOC106172698 [Lingula anatina]|uniref:Uncharacterized protein LOC106172698 n=1 Tax=Lingula anatina TaxID=7574 RepID=A0A1S3JEX4_LINAN|nr:uncharacterized protein LOC106172698 [Lingula anatina]|eukprot:XP_013408965.1 uncharacterized protein LOC106172698 [Lingula anatina]
MATAKTYTDSDQENFFRMSILIVDYALKVVQDVLQKELRKKYPNLFDPNTGLLNKVLGDGTVKTVLFRLSPKYINHQQREQLYPAGNPSTSVTVGDLDLTLTVFLLRNITSLNPHPQFNAWDDPSDTDTSREATIGRIKRYQNIVYGHANNAAISDQDFRAYFLGLKSNLLTLSTKFTNENYDAILSEPLDADLLRKYQGIMEEWCGKNKDVKDTMGAGLKRNPERVTQLFDGQSELKKRCLGQDQQVQTTKETQEKVQVINDKDRDRSELQKMTVMSDTQGDPAVPSSQLFNPSSSTEKEIPQTTESSPTSVDVGTIAASGILTTKPDTYSKAPVMSPTHKNLLVQMGPELIKDLQVEDIVPDMVDRGIISERNAKKVLAHKAENDQAFEFLRILPKCGPRAFETFVDVLRKHNKKELADLLAEKATACSSKNQIASFYIKYMSQIQRLPWDPDDTMHLDDVYVNLQWVQEERKPAGTSSDPIQSYTSIFKDTKQGTRPKRILVRGKAGIGKTTFTQKMATDWANDTLGLKECDRALSNYKHLLIINLRNIRHSQTLKGAIEKQISPSNQNKKEVVDEIVHALDYDSDHVLMVFDGYDEYDPKTSEEITDIIYCKQYQNVCTIITTRPWKAEELMKKQIPDSVYEITGLTGDNIRKYVAKFFDENMECYDLLEWEFDDSFDSESLDESESIGNGLLHYIMRKNLESLVKIPILLLFFCLMWQEDQQSDAKTDSLPTSYTLLYKTLIQMLLRRRYDIRTKDETEESIGQFEETFIGLGKLAYDGLVKPDGGLIFNEKDLQAIPNISELYSLGLLSKSKVHSNLDVKQEVTFPHKTIQEFFAAKYLARKLDQNDSKILDQFLENLNTTDKLYDMSFVLRFLCGLSKKATTKVLRRGKGLHNKDKKRNYIYRYMGHDYVFDGKCINWCNDLLLEHWYAYCPQETVLPPELFSCHTVLYIPGSFEHSDPRFQQVLRDSMCSPQACSGLSAIIVHSDKDEYTVSCEAYHNALSLLSECDMFRELVAVLWQDVCDICDDCRCALKHVLSKAPNLQRLDIGGNCSGAVSSIPYPGKLLHLDVRYINDQDCKVIAQMQHLKYIKATEAECEGMPKDLPSVLGTLPITCNDLTHIHFESIDLCAVGVQLLGRNLHHVPGLEHLGLDWVFMKKVFKWSYRCGPDRCTCPRGEDTTGYDRCQDVCEAVRELSQGVIHTTKLKYFSFSCNPLGWHHGITSPLIALTQSLSTVSEQTGMKIDMTCNDLGRVDRLSELIEAIVSSYQHVSSWDLRGNFLKESLPQPDGSLKCEERLGWS